MGARTVDTIRLEADGRGSFTFSFSSARGEMSGRVNVGTEGPPDKRSTADKEQAAKNQNSGSGTRTRRDLRITVWEWRSSPNWEGMIMTTGSDTAGFAIKVGYYVLAAAVVIFVAMLMLTLYS